MVTVNGTIFSPWKVGKQLRALFDAFLEFQRYELGNSAALDEHDMLSAAAIEQLAFAAREFAQAVESLPLGEQPRGYMPRSTQIQYRVAYNYSKYGPWTDFDGKPILFEAEDGIHRHLIEMRIKPDD